MDHKLTKDERSDLSRRLRNANMDYPGHELRIDLYRLLCHIHASEAVARMSTGENTCEFTCLRDQFERSEIIRILISTSVAIRWAGTGHVDKYREYLDWLKKAEIGVLFKNVSNPISEPLYLLEACNKIVHCEHSEVVSTDTGIPFQDYISEPKVVLHSDFNGNKGWKAIIDINKYVEEGSSIAGAFSQF